MTTWKVLERLADRHVELRDDVEKVRRGLADPTVGRVLDVQIGQLASAAETLRREAAEAAVQGEVAA